MRNLLLILIVVYHVIGQVTDYENFQNYLSCNKAHKQDTSKPYTCSDKDKNSDLYNFMLKIEIPRATECLWSPPNEKRFPCELFGLEK